MYAALPTMPLPVTTSGSFVLPDDISYDEETDLYEMKMLSSWGVPSAERLSMSVAKTSWNSSPRINVDDCERSMKGLATHRIWRVADVLS
jgi:hypothetical protein